ncbi:hypothetical protein C0989_002688, partial [Termitomyces sp. Mn162]
SKCFKDVELCCDDPILNIAPTNSSSMDALFHFEAQQLAVCIHLYFTYNNITFMHGQKHKATVTANTPNKATHTTDNTIKADEVDSAVVADKLTCTKSSPN